MLKVVLVSACTLVLCGGANAVERYRAETSGVEGNGNGFIRGRSFDANRASDRALPMCWRSEYLAQRNGAAACN